MKASELSASAYWTVTAERILTALHDLGTTEIASIQVDPHDSTRHRVLTATPLGVIEFDRTVEQGGEPVDVDRTLAFKVVPWAAIGKIELSGSVTKGFGQFDTELGTNISLKLPEFDLHRRSAGVSDQEKIRSRSEILEFGLAASGYANQRVGIEPASG